MGHRSVTPPRWWLGLGVLIGLCGVSCSGSGKLNPVQGKVLYKNEPLKGALVTFHPKGKDDPKAHRPTAQTKEDGTFTVMTGDREGAPAGEYVVTIICSEVPESGKKVFSTTGPETRDRLGGAYANRDNSRITAQVKQGPNQLEPFDLK